MNNFLDDKITLFNQEITPLVSPSWTPIIKVKKIDPKAIIPTKANEHDAGFDLYALEDIDVPGLLDNTEELIDAKNTGWQGEVSYKPTKIRTGIAFEIPTGYVGLIWDRSSRGSNGYKVFGGVIDATYRGEVLVCLTQLGANGKIAAGEKIAQILIQPIYTCKLEEVKELSDSSRGEKGFGSSGK